MAYKLDPTPIEREITGLGKVKFSPYLAVDMLIEALEIESKSQIVNKPISYSNSIIQSMVINPALSLNDINELSKPILHKIIETIVELSNLENYKPGDILLDDPRENFYSARKEEDVRYSSQFSESFNSSITRIPSNIPTPWAKENLDYINSRAILSDTDSQINKSIENLEGRIKKFESIFDENSGGQPIEISQDKLIPINDDLESIKKDVKNIKLSQSQSRKYIETYLKDNIEFISFSEKVGGKLGTIKGQINSIMSRVDSLETRINQKYQMLLAFIGLALSLLLNVLQFFEII